MAYKYKEYSDSDEVKKAALELAAKESATPVYNSGFEERRSDIMSQIEKRKKFSYDLNADAMYAQLKDSATRNGKKAMEDTMGTAASLTGGYANSWAQSAGQEAYNSELQKLNDMVPTLYEAARSAYDRETQDLYNLYGLYSDREAQDYERYRDEISDHYTELDYLRNKLDSQRSFDYGRHADEQSYAYKVARDAVSDSQWQKEYDEGVRQYNAELSEARRQYDANLLEEQRQATLSAQVSALEAQKDIGLTSKDISTLKSFNGDEEKVGEQIDKWLESGKIDEEYAELLWSYYVVDADDRMSEALKGFRYVG